MESGRKMASPCRFMQIIADDQHAAAFSVAVT